MLRITQGQAAAQRIGYAQIIEGQRCRKLRGSRVTFGGRLKYSNAAAVRFAILEWTGTEDAVTSDVVNDLTSGTYTAGNFFISTTTTVRAVGSLTPSASTMTDFRLSATLGTSFNNLIVLVWTEGTAAQNSALDFAANLKRGFAINPVLFRSFDEELRLCQRFFEKSYDQGAAPGSAVSAGAFDSIVGAATTSPLYGSVNFKAYKRGVPAITLYDLAGTSGKVYKGANGKDGLTNLIGQSAFSAGTGDTTSASELAYQWTAAARL
jgi:hypothetical protein